MIGENSPWILEKAITISKIRSQSASTAIDTGIWPKNAGRRKRRKLGNVSNATKKGTLPRIAKESN